MAVRETGYFDWKIIGTSVVFGILAGSLETFGDYFYFYEGEYWGLAFSQVPGHEVYVRSLLFVVIVAFGVVASWMSKKQQRLETELRQKEERARRKAEEEIEELNSRLATQAPRLERQHRLEAIGQLASGIAHDFNNILTGIQGYVGFVLEELEEESQAAQDVQEIDSLAARAADITSQLLAFSRRQTLSEEIVDLNEIIRQSMKLVSRLIGEDIKLNIQLSDNLDRVKVDRGRIEQVIVNLAINAQDAMPDGGVLSVETQNAELDQDYTDEHQGVEPGDYVMIRVTDTGIGMEESVSSRIFEPFFTTKKSGKGTGLGLATVFGIVKQHGGNIWVDSEPGQGTTFKVYLPRCSDEPQEELQEDLEKSRSALGGTETILVTEDEEPILNMLVRSLSKLGYRVIPAANPNEALQLFRESRDEVALLITDVVLPSKSGPELFMELEKLEPTLRVLYMSGYPDQKIAHRGVLEPGTPFIEKPFTVARLSQLVREVLGVRKN